MKKHLRIISYLLILAIVFTPVSTHAAAKKKTAYVITSITVRSASGGVVDTIKYTYNKRGLVTRQVWNQPGGSCTTSFKYNKNGNITRQSVSEGGKTGSVAYFKYKNGQLVKCNLNYILMKDKETVEYEYNKLGQLKGLTGSNSPETTFKYDKNGYLTQKIELYNYVNAKPEKTSYKYDKKGNVTKVYQGKTLDRIYKNTYVKGTKRLKTVTACYGSGRAICTDYITYKKVKVSKEDAALIKKQQVEWVRDPVFSLFPM